jgi:uncharacterized protein (DUF2147 family)
MNRKCVSTFVSLFLFSALPLAGSLLAQEPRPANASNHQSSEMQPAHSNRAEVRTFSGKITKADGKYVLEDPSAKTPFALDDQKAAKKYDGKSVVVTGSLDDSSNTIHVQKIEAAS